jgi:hypothetical protein
MNKDTARRILGVKNKGLADHLMMTEGSVRNMRDLSKAQEMMVILYYDLKCVTADNVALQDKLDRLVRSLDY